MTKPVPPAQEQNVLANSSFFSEAISADCTLYRGRHVAFHVNLDLPLRAQQQTDELYSGETLPRGMCFTSIAPVSSESLRWSHGRRS